MSRSKYDFCRLGLKNGLNNLYVYSLRDHAIDQFVHVDFHLDKIHILWFGFIDWDCPFRLLMHNLLIKIMLNQKHITWIHDNSYILQTKETFWMPGNLSCLTSWSNYWPPLASSSRHPSVQHLAELIKIFSPGMLQETRLNSFLGATRIRPTKLEKKMCWPFLKKSEFFLRTPVKAFDKSLWIHNEVWSSTLNII